MVSCADLLLSAFFLHVFFVSITAGVTYQYHFPPRPRRPTMAPTLTGNTAPPAHPPNAVPRDPQCRRARVQGDPQWEFWWASLCAYLYIRAIFFVLSADGIIVDPRVPPPSARCRPSKAAIVSSRCISRVFFFLVCFVLAAPFS
jgi:hypothetical protein